MRTNRPRPTSTRRFRRHVRRWPAPVIVGLVVLVAVGWSLSPGVRDEFDPQRMSVPSGMYTLLNVHEDGAMELAGHGDAGLPESFPIHLLGVQLIDQQAATALLRESLPREVRLRFDRRRLDEHGSLQAYVFVGDRLVNADLVRRGWARAHTHPSDYGPILRCIQQAEREARQHARGIWEMSTTRT